jgi:hypothetical protein
MRRLCWYGDNDNDGWDLPLPHTTWAKATDAAMPSSPPTNDKINYDNKDGGKHRKMGGLDDEDKQREQLVDNSRQG